MKVLKARIRWNDGYCNSPDLEVLVNKIPDHNELVYKIHKIDEKATLYFAELGGYVSFYCHDKGSERGFGGRTFCLQLEDGSCLHIKGPWSSNSMTMSRYFTPCMEVSMVDNEEDYNRGYTFYGAAITIEKAKEAVDLIQGASLLKVTQKWLKGEHQYIVSKVGSQPTSVEVIHYT